MVTDFSGLNLIFAASDMRALPYTMEEKTLNLNNNPSLEELSAGVSQANDEGERYLIWVVKTGCVHIDPIGTETPLGFARNQEQMRKAH